MKTIESYISFCFFCLCIILLYGCNLEVIEDDFTGGSGNKVRAIFHSDIVNCAFCCTAQFTNNSQNATSYIWNFGDTNSGSDNSSNETNPSHNFIAPGNYTISLTAFGTASSTHDTTFQITVTGNLTKFANYPGNQKGDKGLDVCMTAAKNGYIIVGGENTVYFGQGPYIVETDLDGNIIDTHNPGGETAYSVSATSDQGFVVAGITDDGTIGKRDIMVVKYDLNRVKLWQKYFGTAENDEVYSMEVLDTDDIIIAGAIKRPGGNDLDMYIAKISAAGNLINENNFGGPYDEIANSIIASSTGGFVVSGRKRDAGGDYDAHILKVNNELSDVVWEISFGSNSTNENARSILESPDGGYIIGGVKQNDLYVIKTDANGVFQWEKTYSSFGEGEIYSLALTLDENVVLTGSATGAGSDAALIKINLAENGTIIWSKKINRQATLWDVGHSIITTPDCGLVIVGFQGDWPIWDVMFIKTDANGNYE